MKFRKKPVVIEATQWFKIGDNPEVEVAYTDLTDKENCEGCGISFVHHGRVPTLEGDHIVCPGDWIITGIKGELYPCKPDIFDATYEPVRQEEAGETS